MQRLRNFIWLPLVLLMAACNSTDNMDYVKLEFQRQGGGNKELFVLKQNFADGISANVNKYNFRDTTFTVKLTRADIGEEIISTLTQLFTGKLNIEGDFKQSTLPTGTWAYIYVVDKTSIRKEITNTQLRDVILKLEPILSNKIS